MTTVTVACKLPNGLVLDLPGVEKKFTLNGSHHREAVAGHGMTEVDDEFWAKWSELHKDFEPVKKELVFAQKRKSSAAAKAEEQKGNKSGLEGIDPEKPAPGIEPVNYEGKKG
ncbi:hypothetical protein [Achromobacter marplatensis]|uniref:hypothetical protein n=1 Tax=Achromobacter marplatensis TaxID=470868 RepID=UPI003C70D2D9